MSVPRFLSRLSQVTRRALHALRVRSFDEYHKGEFFRQQGARIGEGTRILVNSLGSEPYLVSIGDETLIGPDVLFVTHDAATWVGRDLEPLLNVFAPISVGKRCFIGARAVLLPGTIVGDRSIVGAGAVLRGEYPAESLIVGVPGRVVGSTDGYLERARRKSLWIDWCDREGLRATLEGAFLDNPVGADDCE